MPASGPLRQSYINCHVEFRNFGLTPAYDFHAWITALVRDLNDLPRWRHVQKAGQPTNQLLGPGAETIMDHSVEVKPDELVPLRKGDKVIYFWGIVKYCDAFGRQRSFAFRRQSMDHHVFQLEDRWASSPAPGG